MNIGMRILAAAVLSAAISFPASAIGGPGVPPPPGAPKTPGYQAPVPPAPRAPAPTGKYVGRSDSYARQQNAPKPVSGSLNR